MLELHLEKINARSVRQFKADVFVPYAIFSPSIKLGVNGYGKYVVQNGEESTSYDLAHDAINAYKQILNGE